MTDLEISAVGTRIASYAIVVCLGDQEACAVFQGVGRAKVGVIDARPEIGLLAERNIETKSACGDSEVDFVVVVVESALGVAIRCVANTPGKVIVVAAVAEVQVVLQTVADICALGADVESGLILVVQAAKR